MVTFFETKLEKTVPIAFANVLMNLKQTLNIPKTNRLFYVLRFVSYKTALLWHVLSLRNAPTFVSNENIH